MVIRSIVYIIIINSDFVITIVNSAQYVVVTVEQMANGVPSYDKVNKNWTWVVKIFSLEFFYLYLIIVSYEESLHCRLYHNLPDTLRSKINRNTHRTLHP